MTNFYDTPVEKSRVYKYKKIPNWYEVRIKFNELGNIGTFSIVGDAEYLNLSDEDIRKAL